MSNYTKLTDFASKDALPTGTPNKIVKGTEIDDEFEAIETAVTTKADINSPALTGTPTAPTAGAGNNTTQLATTAFVTTAIANDTLDDNEVTTAKINDAAVTESKIADDAVTTDKIADNAVTADELNVSGNGTSGQVLKSDGDGSFSWENRTALMNLPIEGDRQRVLNANNTSFTTYKSITLEPNQYVNLHIYNNSSASSTTLRFQIDGASNSYGGLPTDNIEVEQPMFISAVNTSGSNQTVNFQYRSEVGITGVFHYTYVIYG
jgi:hypothetical protein